MRVAASLWMKFWAEFISQTMYCNSDITVAAVKIAALSLSPPPTLPHYIHHTSFSLVLSPSFSFLFPPTYSHQSLLSTRLLLSFIFISISPFLLNLSAPLLFCNSYIFSASVTVTMYRYNFCGLSNGNDVPLYFFAVSVTATRYIVTFCGLSNGNNVPLHFLLPQ